MHTAASRTHATARLPAQADILAGGLAGLIAGVAYLVAQMAFAATLHGGDAWDPLHRIAAMLLGPEAAPPAVFEGQVVLIALLIHLPLAALYGRVLAGLSRGASLAGAMLRGALMGLAIYGLNFLLLAPVLFPWYEESRTLSTALDHVLFGGLAALCYAQLAGRPLGRQQ